jgi:hypothetical protein
MFRLKIKSRTGKKISEDEEFQEAAKALSLFCRVLQVGRITATDAVGKNSRQKLPPSKVHGRKFT